MLDYIGWGGVGLCLLVVGLILVLCGIEVIATFKECRKSKRMK